MLLNRELITQKINFSESNNKHGSIYHKMVLSKQTLKEISNVQLIELYLLLLSLQFIFCECLHYKKLYINLFQIIPFQHNQ